MSNIFDNIDIYSNPIVDRYASKEMAENFGDIKKIKLWRKLWIVLAESQKELGLPITDEQINDLIKYKDDINFDVAKEIEKQVRHDVMSHIYAYGLLAKKAAPIIHLGATSCYVTDNADIIIFHDALKILRSKILGVIDLLTKFATEYKELPTLGYTHLQVAQITTVGKRATLWINDLLDDFYSLDDFIKNIKLRGAKGTTGSQASFLTLFDNDYKKVLELDKAVANKMGYSGTVFVSGQTYSRKSDYKMLTLLSGIAQSAYKFASDIRLLQAKRELEESFEKNQIGSSAMAYKRNPIRSERLCSLARFVINLPQNIANTVVTQWLERTLDDSAIRKIVIPQSFLALDAVLDLYINIVSGLVANKEIINFSVSQELPFMATEEIIMNCVKSGQNRQDIHEKIRCYSMETIKAMRENNSKNDLFDKILKDDAFASIHNNIKDYSNPKRFVGMSIIQVDEFLNGQIRPILEKEKNNIVATSKIEV